VLLRYPINKQLISYMGKLYAKKRQSIKEMKPSKSAVSFILSYSQAMKMIKVGTLTFENIVN
jgi:hypothetical protein